MDTIAAIRVFVRVVEAGSFSGAARHLGLAPSSVSRQISELEDQLSATLFHRTTRKLSLTEAGHTYFERAERVLHEVDEAELAVAQLDGSPTGVLRITMPSGVGRFLLAETIPAFCARYPAVKFVLSMTDRLIDLVDTGFDLAIRVGQQRDSSLIARKIAESARIVCGSPAYLERAGEPTLPSELADHDCLTWREHPGSNLWRFEGKDGRSEVRASGSLFAANADALVAAAVGGLGLVLLPDWNVGIELREGQLRPVLSSYRAVPATSTIYAVYPRDRHRPPKVRAFIDFLVEHFSSQGRASRMQ
ncbi:MAG: LysR family transcriptional regulator [Myxococcales bacterium]|nr:LysR family transcriptional regulator [Myxococcales bacterium]